MENMKKIHRFITPYNVTHNQIKITDKELIHQWKNVLKFKNGEDVVLVNKEVGEAICTLQEINQEYAIFDIQKINKRLDENQKEITLYMAILKNENFELVIQKASEIGIQKIVPIITTRTIKTGIKLERLTKIAKEASELSGGINIPLICEPILFNDALKDVKKYEQKIIFHPSEQKYKSTNKTNIAIFVGPEGGFTDQEIIDAEKNGCEVMSLGKSILRGETAGIVASYITMNI